MRLAQNYKTRSTLKASLRSWRDFAQERFCFGREAVSASGEAVRGLVKSRVEFPLANSLAGFAREIRGSAAARPLTIPASYAG